MMEVDEHEENYNEANEAYFKKFYDYGILEIILKNVKKRRNAANVNKIFYQTVCEIDNEKDIYKMVIESYASPMTLVLDSILHSKRIFTEISMRSLSFSLLDKETNTISSVNEAEFRAFCLILSHFSSRLRTLTISLSLLDENHVMKIMDALKDSPVQNINITYCGIFIVSNPVFPEAFRRQKILPQLKSLNFAKSSYGSTLVSDTNHEKVLPKFLEMLAVTHNNQLKSFTLTKTIFFMELDAFAFESLAILNSGPSNVRIAPIINRQYRLKELDLSTTFIMDDVLMEIINLKFLRTLRINCEGTTMKNFSLITTMDLHELHFEVKRSSHWLPLLMATLKFESVKKLSLNLPYLELPVDNLQAMLQEGIQELSIVTAQAMALQGIFTSKASSFLESISLEITKPNRSSMPQLIKGFNRSFRNVKVLKIINRNSSIAGQTRELVSVLAKLPQLKKLYIEGFKISEMLHSAILKALKNLDELTLLNYSKDSDYVIPATCKKAIKQCKNLKMMKISCKNSLYSDVIRFPVEMRRGQVIVYRHR